MTRGLRVIGKLRGVIDAYGEDFVIVDVGGVGYLVNCSSRKLQHLHSVARRRRSRSRPMSART